MLVGLANRECAPLLVDRGEAVDVALVLAD